MDRGELPGQQRPEEQAKINAKREAKLRQEEEQRAKEAAAARKEEEKKLRAERERQKEVPSFHALDHNSPSAAACDWRDLLRRMPCFLQSFPIQSVQNTRCMELTSVRLR
jgi:hypothetical protein